MIAILNEAEIRRAITPADAIEAVRQAFAADGRGQTVVPSVINLAIPGTDGEFHVKTAYVAGIPHVAVKVASGFYDNPKRGLPTGSGMMVLLDATTGMLVALLLDNGYLTDVRTGAAGAVAAECLARKSIETVGVIGSGVQARQQAVCLQQVRSFKRVVAWSPDAPGLARYASEMHALLGVETIAARDAEQVVGTADVLVTATPSRVPLVRAEWLRPGMHVTALGSDGPGKQELEAECLGRADIVVCDRLSQCGLLGELQHALAAGVLREGDVHAELGQVVAGIRPGRTSDSQMTIADLTGVGIQDTAIASLAYARAGGPVEGRTGAA
jgi:ectoine utilization protein EutC